MASCCFCFLFARAPGTCAAAPSPGPRLARAPAPVPSAVTPMSSAALCALLDGAGPSVLSMRSAFEEWVDANVKPPFAWSADECKKVLKRFEDNDCVFETCVERLTNALGRHGGSYTTDDVVKIISVSDNILIKEKSVKVMAPLVCDVQNKQRVVDEFSENSIIKSNVAKMEFGNRDNFHADEPLDDVGGVAVGEWESRADLARAPKHWKEFWKRREAANQGDGPPPVASDSVFKGATAEFSFYKLGEAKAPSFMQSLPIVGSMLSAKWQSRYARIRSGVLFYFEDASPNAKALGCIGLKGADADASSLQSRGGYASFVLRSPLPRRPDRAGASEWVLGAGDAAGARELLAAVQAHV